MNKEWQDRVDALKEQVWPWWSQLIQMWFEELYEDCPSCDISNIWCKEEYWSLRFEWPFQSILHSLENASEHICEECGAIWRIRWDRSWNKCLCNSCNLLDKQKNEENKM